MIHQSQFKQHTLVQVQNVENSMQKNVPALESAINAASGKVERNLLIDMERTFEGGRNHLTSPNAQSVYDKLHSEIKQFKSGIGEIMKEMQPVKNLIIQKITQLIQKSVPDADVKVYGSHAT